jgi:hypothetical protein
MPSPDVIALGKPMWDTEQVGHASVVGLVGVGLIVFLWGPVL